MFVGKVYARVAYPKVYLDVKGGLCKYIWLISKGVISIYGYMDIQEQTDFIQGCASGGLGCPRRQWASHGGKPRRAISLLQI